MYTERKNNMDKSNKSKISTEILSAYMDNNLSSQDMELVAAAINENPEMLELCSMNDIANEIISENKSEELPLELINDDFSIPSFDDLCSVSNDRIKAYEDIVNEDYFEGISNSENNYIDSSDSTDRNTHVSGSIYSENNKNNSDMERNDKLTIGYEPNENKDTFDPQIFQGPNPTCAICSQEVVLRDFGIDISREELIQFATKEGWFLPDPQYGGTPKEAVGNILDAFGIQTNRYENASFGDFVRELAAGHRLIVSVDADELWIKKEPELHKRLFGEVKNKVNDALQNAFGVEGANHALVVAGINVNPKDPSDVHVVLIDTGSGDYCIEYTWKQFSDALADSHNYVIATKDAAPYQYNYHTNKLEPSGFDSNFIPSMAHIPEGLHNNFSLPESYYSLYENYTPFFDFKHFLSANGVLAEDVHIGSTVSSEDEDQPLSEDPDDDNFLEELSNWEQKDDEAEDDSFCNNHDDPDDDEVDCENGSSDVSLGSESGSDDES